MKQLSEVLPDISNIATQPSAKQNTSAHGLIKTDGKMITQFPLIESKEQAISINSLILRSKPIVKWTKVLKRGEHFVRHADDLTLWDIEQKYPDCRLVNIQTIERPEMTDDENRIIEYYKQPAERKTIKAHLVKLSGHKRIAGDDNQIRFTLSEAVKACKGATELQIYRAYDYFSFEDESDFFPNIAKLKKKVFEM